MVCWPHLSLKSAPARGSTVFLSSLLSLALEQGHSGPQLCGETRAGSWSHLPRYIIHRYKNQQGGRAGFNLNKQICVLPTSVLEHIEGCWKGEGKTVGVLHNSGPPTVTLPLTHLRAGQGIKEGSKWPSSSSAWEGADSISSLSLCCSFPNVFFGHMCIPLLSSLSPPLLLPLLYHPHFFLSSRFPVPLSSPSLYLPPLRSPSCNYFLLRGLCTPG